MCPELFSLVGQEIRTAIDENSGPDSFRDLLYLPLRQPGKVLGGAPSPRWVMLVCAASRAAGGAQAATARVAAAVELFVAAADLFDEIEDGDASAVVTASSLGQAANVASALLMLAQECLARLGGTEIPAHRVPDFCRTLSQYALKAAAGQHMDLASEGLASVDVNKAFEIARSKAGELGAVACRLGAMCGTENTELLDIYAEFGRHLGTMGQLANDAQDALDTITKSDVRLQKRTVVRAFQDGSNAARTIPGVLTGEDQGQAALAFTQVVIGLERQAALDALERLAQRGHCISELRELVG